MSTYKPTCLVVFLLLVSNFLSAQDYAAVDQKVRTYPTFAKPANLATQIAQDFTTDEHKARAIFTWIANNIQYDVPQYLASGGVRQAAFSYRSEAEKLQKEKQFRDQIVMDTWRSKKAICHGYAELFNYVGNLVGLESVLVPGASKTHPTHIGKLPSVADHAWNAVKVNGKWQLVDVTWAAGGIDGATRKFVRRFNDSYFFADPNVFFLNHWPDDSKMLLTSKTPQDFAKLPLYYGEYLDSDYTIVTPFEGTLSSASPQIPFKIENYNGKRISYVFSSNNIFNTVVPIQNGTTAEFIIPVAKNESGYLTIYIDSGSVVTYKIQRNLPQS